MKNVSQFVLVSMLILGLIGTFTYACYSGRVDAGEPRIKQLATLPGDYGNVWTFVAEPAPGLRVACVEATHSGGLWCTRRETGEEW